MKKFLLKTVCLISVLTGSASASTIQIEPGQCIMAGDQQVCAAKRDDCYNHPTKLHEKIVSKAECRFGAAYENDKTLKGYGLYVLRMTKKDSSKKETLVKTFSPAQKDECEAAAASYTDE